MTIIEAIKHTVSKPASVLDYLTDGLQSIENSKTLQYEFYPIIKYAFNQHCQLCKMIKPNMSVDEMMESFINHLDNSKF